MGAERRTLAQIAMLACVAQGASARCTSSPFSVGKPKTPFELLSLSMKRECDFNVCALIDQRDPMVAGWQRVKVDRDQWGHVHMCVLQPLRMEGVESIDDGNRWQTVLPDEGVVLDYESPSHDECDEMQRMRLAKKNYRFEVTGRSEVAGRSVIEVSAKPTRGQMAMRRYSLDAETLYPLKVENVQNGSSDVEFVTVDISYPKKLSRDQFKLRSTMGLKVYRFDRPQNVKLASDAKRILGFAPFLPKGNPMGFETQEMQINQDGSWQALVVRLSDGLARATVYEYVSDQHSVRAMDQSSSRQVDGINLLVVSPLGETVRQNLLDSLASRRLTQTWSVPRSMGPSLGTSEHLLYVRNYTAPAFEATSNERTNEAMLRVYFSGAQ